MYINTSELFPCLIFFISLILLLPQGKKDKAMHRQRGNNGLQNFKKTSKDLNEYFHSKNTI
jgi:hypothetical protein